MTFEEWFAENYTDVTGVDRNTRALLRASARQAFTNCWNAAVDEAARWISEPGELTEQARFMATAVKKPVKQ